MNTIIDSVSHLRKGHSGASLRDGDGAAAGGAAKGRGKKNRAAGGKGRGKNGALRQEVKNILCCP